MIIIIHLLLFTARPKLKLRCVWCAISRPAKSPGISGSLQKWRVISRSPGIVKKTPGIEVIWVINNFPARNPDFCRICPKCVSLLTNITEWACHWMLGKTKSWLRGSGDDGKLKIAVTTPPPPHRIRVGFWGSRKIAATNPPPPPNRVGFWRSRKRLKKFNNLNLAALYKSD